MTLDDAKAQLEVLPGVYDVCIESWRSGFYVQEVQFCIRIASPELLPEETRQGILRIRETLERELGCIVSVAVSTGLRLPDGEET